MIPRLGARGRTLVDIFNIIYGYYSSRIRIPEVRIYKKKDKKVRKKERKHALDQEKKKVYSFFLGRFLCRELVFLFCVLFLDGFLGRKRFVLFSLINSHLWSMIRVKLMIK